MKLNLNYYKEELDNKMIPEEFEEVLEKVNRTDKDFSKTLDKKSKIKNILALSEIRENFLNWYEFKDKCTILELNANYGEITGLLCDKAKNVVSIEESNKFAGIVEKRHKDRTNLELVVGNIENIKIKEKFDYAVIVGIAQSLDRYVQYAKEHLKEDGTIIIGINNKFGVKSWITEKEENKVVSNSNTAVSKNTLERLMKDFNFKYYYPLPDYKLPNIIYTPKYIPSVSNIDRDLTYKDENVNFKEVDAYKEILKEEPEKFFDFANSFLVEASKSQIQENEIKFIAFSNMRKDEYRIRTIVKDKEVYKTSVNEKSKEHIGKIKENIDILKRLNINTLDSYNENTIISKYCRESTLDEVLLNIYKEKGIEEFIEKIKEYTEFLETKLERVEFKKNNIFKKYKIDYDIEKIKKLNFVKYGLWDLIFSNCFVIDNEYYFYDQEWLEENIPVEYIIYRAVKYFNRMKRYMSDDEILQKLELLEYKEVFDDLDNKIQEKIRKPLFWNIHTKDELVKNKTKEIQKLKAEIVSLKNAYIEKNNELAILKESFSWKITKPLRTIRKFTRK